ncbi:MAG: polysaccharide deacetylase family protein [Planctomycetota bacterium]|jgi:peptidoglycan/xylan/chitin deacetylase (PgdA/CDA1 family)
MSIFKGLKFMFYSRGVKKGFKRLSYINKRFGLTAAKQMKSIDYYASLLRRHNIKGTFFIPATLLESYFKDINRIKIDNIEWGIHSDIHTDLSRLGKEAQMEHIDNAVEIFDKLGVLFRGFRAPYLRINDYTLGVIDEKNRFLYDSSSSILWEDVYKGDESSSNWIRNFYKPQFHSQKISFPEMFSEGLVEMPVSLPDDDILLDREDFDVDSVLSVWENILEICSGRKELFVLQLHPERIYDLDSALDSLIKKAKSFDPPIWIASLGEIAEWRKNTASEKWPVPYHAAFCITGDIDSITILDFLKRLKEW